MRAFLSHSSSDKGYVEAVTDSLRPGLYELDAKTFDEGGLNADEIVKALNRCDLFCLFLSKAAIESRYVQFEIAFGRELIASGKISRILTICLDEEAFQEAQGYIKHYNMVRCPRSPESAARLIEGKLIASKHSKAQSSHPFVGRESDLKILEKQANDLERPRIKALYISGNSGSGRRTVAKKFFQNQFPQVGVVPPRIELDSFKGYDDIYRAIISNLRPSIPISELLSLAQKFEGLSPEGKASQIAREINGLLDDRETLHVIDSGGLLREDGSFQPEFDAVLNEVTDRPHPPLVFISTRMIPQTRRRASSDLAYLAVSALSREDTERLISGLLKDRDVKASSSQVEKLVDMADQHPFNVYRMVDLISSSSVDIFLGNPRDFIEWKHKQTSEYLQSAKLNEIDFKILAIFSIAPELDFYSLTHTLDFKSNEISESLQKLQDLHVLTINNDRISISPALRIASERDPRTELKGNERTKIMQLLSESLAVRVEEGDAPITLLDSAILATLESGAPTTKLMEAFILPSHRVWLAKRHYDAKSWKESIRMAREAIEGKKRLSRSGTIAACRYLGLAAARINDQQTFEYGISQLRLSADDDWSKSNIHFLHGFNLRLQGNLSEAKNELSKSYDLAPGSRATSRELASVCLSLDTPLEAEGYAREAYENAQNNPYIIDILISCLIRNKKGKCVNDQEVIGLLDKLEGLDEEVGRSFHSTRRAEIEYLYGDIRQAQTLIKTALQKTPRLFAPLSLHSKILLKSGNLSSAKDQINIAKSIVFDRSGFDLRANHRPLLQLEAEYFIAILEFDKAMEIYRNSKLFSVTDIETLKKEIDTVKYYRNMK